MQRSGCDGVIDQRGQFLDDRRGPGTRDATPGVVAQGLSREHPVERRSVELAKALGVSLSELACAVEAER